MLSPIEAPPTRQRRLGAALAVALAFGCSDGPPVQQPAAPRTERPAVEIEGHRGARGLAPENTLEGFRTALAVGVDVLELDVGLTGDGVLVVHHDTHLAPDIARDASGAWLTPPTPALRELRASELAAYDVGRLRPGSDYAARFPEQRGRDGVRIPRLAEVFELVEDASGATIRYDIETKLSPDEPDATAPPEVLADAVVALVRQHDLGERVTVQSFDWRTLARVREVAPDLTRACLTSEDPEGDTLERGRPGASPWTAGLDLDAHGGSVPRLVEAAGCAVWSPRFADVSADEVAEAHRLGLRVVVWTVNALADIEAALDLGVDGIISDRPDRVRAVFQRRGLSLPGSRGD